MANWRSGKWGDFATLEYGKGIRGYLTEPSEDAPYRVYGTNGPIGWWNEPLCHKPGIIIGRKGAYRGVHYSATPFFVIDTAFYLNLHSCELDTKWAYYQLVNVDINTIDSGSAIPSTSREAFYQIAVNLPPLPTQRKIAAILSTYDDLIENNTRRIALLEEMARALYREWFVEFRYPGHTGVPLVESPLGPIPQGWRVMPITDALRVDPSTRVSRDGEKPFVPMGSLSNTSMVISPIESREGNSGSKFRNGDTLFARITPCIENGKTGFVQFLPDEDSVAFGSTEFIVLRSKSLCPEYVYLLARTNEFRDNAIKSMTGATGRQRVQSSSFERFLIAHPDEQTLSAFQAQVAPAFQLIHTLSERNANLRRTHDLLLPKLVSGEVDVAGLEIEVGEVQESTNEKRSPRPDGKGH
jgi:type I restriction enzyme S subunit